MQSACYDLAKRRFGPIDEDFKSSSEKMIYEASKQSNTTIHKTPKYGLSHQINLEKEEKKSFPESMKNLQSKQLNLGSEVGFSSSGNAINLTLTAAVSPECLPDDTTGSHTPG